MWAGPCDTLNLDHLNHTLHCYLLFPIFFWQTNLVNNLSFSTENLFLGVLSSSELIMSIPPWMDDENSFLPCFKAYFYAQVQCNANLLRFFLFSTLRFKKSLGWQNSDMAESKFYTEFRLNILYEQHRISVEQCRIMENQPPPNSPNL
jgi:hypothetical protein